MIGAVGTILGNRGVNISQMQVNVGIQRGGNAMMVMCIDDPVPPECMRDIQAIPGMIKASIVELFAQA